MKPAIKVSKLFIRFEARKRRSIRSLFNRVRQSPQCVRAIKSISFDVAQGEIVGIIGSNGSGKSTLLRAIAGLISPNIGSVTTYNNSVSLLSLGTGFVPDLSGRDNIYLSGLSMGYSKMDIDKQLDGIITFSELGEAIDRPVKTYSSGMYSKLAFSIAITLTTDILLIDEVLSVGDLRFRRKSYSALEKIIKDNNRTIVIVSHNLSEIKKLCNRVIWMENGQILIDGAPETVLDLYYMQMSNDPDNITYLQEPSLRIYCDTKSVTITWDPVENAQDYRIYRKENVPGSKWTALIDGYAGTSYTDIPPDDKISYFYTVRARATGTSGNIWSPHHNNVLGSISSDIEE